jgi:hypothetical protein
LKPRLSRDPDRFDGFATRMGRSPVTVTPIDCPKFPAARSNSKFGTTRGARMSTTDRDETIPALVRREEGNEVGPDGLEGDGVGGLANPLVLPTGPYITSYTPSE